MKKLMEDGVKRMKERAHQRQGQDFYLEELDLLPLWFSSLSLSWRILPGSLPSPWPFALRVSLQPLHSLNIWPRVEFVLTVLFTFGGSSESKIPTRDISSSPTLPVECDLLEFHCLWTWAGCLPSSWGYYSPTCLKCIWREFPETLLLSLVSAITVHSKMTMSI